MPVHMLPNRLAIGSLSLGQHVSHKLDDKICTAAQHGFAGIEIVYSDLKTYAEKHTISILEAAMKIRDLCDHHDILVLSLAPFENFEGHNSPLEERLVVAQHWMDVARKLNALWLQVPAQYSKECTGDQEIIISELQQLSDIGSATEPVVAIAYEPMSWSTHYSTWQSTLELIKKVDRDNFGLCLDSFHVLTKLWGDPLSPTGKYSNADQQLADSLKCFKQDFPMDKLFYVQLSDGERFDPPFSNQHPWYTEGEAPQFTWSRHARPFPLESHLGGYLPVTEFVRACIAETAFSGWVSMEIFDRRMREKSFQPEAAAIRGVESWNQLCRGLTTTSKI